jgi:hypothetical protein
MLQLYDAQYMYYQDEDCTGQDLGKSPYLRFSPAYFVPLAVLLLCPPTKKGGHITLLLSVGRSTSSFRSISLH